MPASKFLAEPEKESIIDLRETDILVRYRNGQRPTAAPVACCTLASYIKQIRPARTVTAALAERTGNR